MLGKLFVCLIVGLRIDVGWMSHSLLQYSFCFRRFFLKIENRQIY
nr:MAG TPA: hypothetical protein [Caudoviricetes sp.]